MVLHTVTNSEVLSFLKNMVIEFAIVDEAKGFSRFIDIYL